MQYRRPVGGGPSGKTRPGWRHCQAAADAPLPSAFDRCIEARPAGAALELGLTLEQGLSTACANEGPRPLLVQERATARPLGAVATHDIVLLGAQNFSPLGVGVGDGKVVFFHEILLENPYIGLIRAGTRPVRLRATLSYASGRA